jgi:hypothetical protein
VVIFIVNVPNVGARKHEGYAPVSTHPDGPTALPVAFQGVQLQAWQRHVSRFDRYVQPAEDQSKPTGVLCIYSGSCAAQEKTFQSLVPEFENRHSENVTRNVAGYNTRLTIRPSGRSAAQPAAELAC